MGQIGKLGLVDAKLGASMPGQQTTRIIFDTITPGAVVTNRLDFFKTFQNKTLGQTNLTTNKLDSSESMVIKSIWLWQSLGDIYGIPFGAFGPENDAPPQILNILVGNQKVVKNLPIQFNTNGDSFDRLHALNGGRVSTWLAPGPPSGSNSQQVGPLEIRLLTDIVIPPQVSFSVSIENAGAYGSGENTYTCALAGYGRIFSAGSSF
jgi:hypothetical protein